MVIQTARVHFFQRNRTQIEPDQDRLPTQALQPFDHVLGIADTPAEQQQLRLARGQGQSQFVIQSAVGIADHLVFVDHQQRRAVALNQPPLLGFEGGDENRRVQVFRQITRGNADIPAARPPFG